jgi:hypothetical protein
MGLLKVEDLSNLCLLLDLLDIGGSEVQGIGIFLELRIERISHGPSFFKLHCMAYLVNQCLMLTGIWAILLAQKVQ